MPQVSARRDAQVEAAFLGFAAGEKMPLTALKMPEAGAWILQQLKVLMMYDRNV